MILDARGPNLLEAGLNRWTQSLGCAESFLQICLAENEVLLLPLLYQSSTSGSQCPGYGGLEQR